MAVPGGPCCRRGRFDGAPEKKERERGKDKVDERGAADGTVTSRSDLLPLQETLSD